MSYNISGKLLEISDIQQISEKFKKREFVIESERVINPEMVFTDYVKFQLTQNKVSLIETFEVGQMVDVSFDIRGNKWEKDGAVKYFVNLEAWKIENVQAAEPSIPVEAAASGPVQQNAPPGDPPPIASDDDDELPF